VPRVECIFCAIVSGSAPASFVHEDDEVMAFVDLRPVNPGHLLVVPRRHEQLIVDLDASTWARLCIVGRRLDAALRVLPELRCEAVNLVVADGPAAGQEIAHAHLHVIPRFDGDGFGFRHARGYGAVLPQHAMDAMAATVRAALAA
jgi:histidine triad (HIT) family protein